jgi:hypothetical protein
MYQVFDLDIWKVNNMEVKGYQATENAGASSQRKFANARINISLPNPQKNYTYTCHTKQTFYKKYILTNQRTSQPTSKPFTTGFT